jgi:TorA maturation chaperone TorD
MDKEWLLRREEHRRGAYKLLSQCYFLPDEALLEALACSDECMVSPWLGGSYRLPTGGEIESLKVDYSRLFLGPYQLLAPPYGSVYLENSRTVMGDSTMDARKRYMEAGLNLTLKDAPDHVAIEMEFMYYLVHREIEAILNTDAEAMALFVRRQKEFLNNHLDLWIPEFTNRVLSGAETEFYRGIARVTRTFIAGDIERLIEDPLAMPVNLHLSS